MLKTQRVISWPTIQFLGKTHAKSANELFTKGLISAQ